MTALLELPVVRQRARLLSVEEYHRAGAAGILGKDTELLRGVVVTKMSKSPLHEQVIERLMELLGPLLPREFKMRKEGPLTLHDSEPEPDLSIVRRGGDWEKSHPRTALLVIEVAVTSFDLDQNKAAIYAEAGIPEFWLVLPSSRRIDVYRQPSPQGYQTTETLGEGDVVQCLSVSQIAFPVSAFLPPV